VEFLGLAFPELISAIANYERAPSPGPFFVSAAYFSDRCALC